MNNENLIEIPSGIEKAIDHAAMNLHEQFRDRGKGDLRQAWNARPISIIEDLSDGLKLVGKFEIFGRR